MQIEKDFIQPLGEHNPECDCVRTQCVSHLVKYPFPHLNPMQSDFVPYLEMEDKNIVITGPTSSGKCINRDTLTITSSGMLAIGEICDDLEPGESRKIKKIVSTPLTINGKDKAETIYRDGISNSITIETLSGYKITGTCNHKIKVLENDEIIWKKMSEIKNGDYAILTRGQNCFGNSKEINSPDFAYWLGLLTGDGGMTTKNVIHFTNEDDHIISFFIKFIKERINYDVKNKPHRISKKCRELFLCNVEFKRELNRLGFDNVLSVNKVVPKCIRTAPKQIVSMFLRGLMETDGWIQHKTDVCFGTSSKVLARQVHTIFLNFGIYSSLTSKKTKCNEAYRVVITGENVGRFIQQIGFDPNGHKYATLKKEYDKNNIICREKLIIPQSFWIKIRQIITANAQKKSENVKRYYSKIGIKYKTLASLCHSNSKKREYGRYSSRLNFNKIMGRIIRFFKGKDEIEEILTLMKSIQKYLDKNILFLPINKLYREESDNYDFVVPESHSFVANGFVNHNTLIAELAAAQVICSTNMGKKAIILAPMKSLTEEKLRDWTDDEHTFSKFKIAVLTGDYSLNKDKAKELEEANIVICTSEMLDSKTRNYEGNKWLHNCGALIVDEAHLIGSKERGPRLETAIMRFNEWNKDCRIILMSATIPNVEDLVTWVKNLSGKETILIKSNYRPCKLKKHFLEFNDLTGERRKKYQEIEQLRMQVVYDQILKNPDDQHIIFVGNKSFGRNMAEMLKSKGFYAVDFHCADLEKDKRIQIEKNFNDGNIKYLVSSSTLAWGVNMSARRVILAHTSYGMSEMDIADIEQACGRAGRTKFHTEGDAYIVVPSSKSYAEIKRITGGFSIDSKLKDQKILAFHIISEIVAGKIDDVHGVFEWYKRSLAYSQEHSLTEDDCESLMSRLKAIKMIKISDTDENKYVATQMGQITSAMYQNPFDVFDWFKNFSMLKQIGVASNGHNKDELEQVDLQVCWALANIDANQESSGAFVSAAEKDSDVVVAVAKKIGKMVPATKIAACYWSILNGHDVDDSLRSLYYGLYADMQRVLTTLQLIHIKYASFLAKQSESMPGWRYDKSEWDRLYLRFKYGVSRNKVFLVSLPEIGKTYAEKMFNAGIRSKNDVLTKRIAVEEIIGKKRAERLYAHLIK